MVGYWRSAAADHRWICAGSQHSPVWLPAAAIDLKCKEWTLVWCRILAERGNADGVSA
jgi:hypothetical protein